MSVNVNTDHRPVKPLDLSGGLAAAWSDGSGAAGVPADEPVLLVDPTTRRLFGTPVPQSMATELRGIFDRLSAGVGRELDAPPARPADEEAIERVAASVRAVGRHLRTLKELFHAAIVDRPPEQDELCGAAFHVSNSVETFSDRIADADRLWRARGPGSSDVEIAWEVIEEGVDIAREMRGLATMFDGLITACGEAGEAIAPCRLVVDIVRTMADRLTGYVDLGHPHYAAYLTRTRPEGRRVA